jgi:hypothetical protein
MDVTTLPFNARKRGFRVNVKLRRQLRSRKRRLQRRIDKNAGQQRHRLFTSGPTDLSLTHVDLLTGDMDALLDDIAPDVADRQIRCSNNRF